MNKKYLYIASALLSVVLLSGIAQAKTDVLAATATKAGGMAAENTGNKMMAKPMMSKLSEAGQKVMQELMAKSHEDNKEVFEQIKTKHAEMDALMKAVTFDKEAYLAKAEEIHLLHHKMMKARAESKASAIVQLSPEDRAILADAPRHHHMGMKDGKGMGAMGMGMNPECPMMEGGMMGGKGPMHGMSKEPAMK